MASENKPGRAARAKPAAARPAARRPHRGGLLSMDSEQSARTLLLGVTAAVLIAAAAFIAVGYYVSVIQPRGRTVLRVDDISVSYSAMKRRMAYEYYLNPSFQDPQAVFNVQAVAYQNLVEELTLISRAESDLGVTLDDAEAEKRLREKVGVDENADAQTFADRFRSALAVSRLHEGEYRRLVRAEALESKAREKLKERIPSAVPQAKVEVIVVAEQAEAEAAIDRVKAGEAWADVARAVSLESDAATTGGVKDYNFEGGFPAAYDTYAFSAPIGEISAPLQDPSGAGPFYAVRIADRADMPLTDTQKASYESDQYLKWLEDTQTMMTIVDNWTMDDQAQADAVRPLYDDAVHKARQRIEDQLRPQPTVQIPAAVTTSAAETPAVVTPDGSGQSTPAATPPADGQ
jgi:parvulin-like peptidyl-prolyl isomerase